MGSLKCLIISSSIWGIPWKIVGSPGSKLVDKGFCGHLEFSDSRSIKIILVEILWVLCPIRSITCESSGQISACNFTHTPEKWRIFLQILEGVPHTGPSCEGKTDILWITILWTSGFFWPRCWPTPQAHPSSEMRANRCGTHRDVTSVAWEQSRNWIRRPLGELTWIMLGQAASGPFLENNFHPPQRGTKKGYLSMSQRGKKWVLTQFHPLLLKKEHVRTLSGHWQKSILIPL